MPRVDARDEPMLPVDDQEKDMSEEAVVRRVRAALRGYEEWRASNPCSSSLVCITCRHDCNRTDATGLTFTIRLDGDTSALIVPCYAWHQFSAIPGSSLLFQASGSRTYEFEVHKGNSRAIIGGDNWRRFVEDFDLREGDLVSFDLTEDIPRVYFRNLPRAGDQNKEHKDPIESAVIMKGINLTEQEELNLHDLLATKKGYVGAFFVHRFTKSNIAGKMMRLPTKVVDTLMTQGDGEISGDGLAGIGLGENSFRPVKYHKCDDGRIIFGKGWSDFIDSEELKIHKAVLFAFKTTTREDLQIKVVMNILTDEPQM